MTIDRRRFLVGSLGAAGVGLLGSCSDDSSSGADPNAGGASSTTSPTGSPTTGTPLAPPGSAGLVDEAVWQARIDEYLAVVTAETDPENFASVSANLLRSRREPDYEWDPSTVTVESFQRAWDQIDAWEDTRDFRFMDLHWLIALADGSTPMTTIDPAIVEAAETRMAANRWQYDDPLPDDRVDNQWFWSENHVIIGLAGEYLAGQRLPDTTFEITGLTGAEHMERTRPAILAWIDERARFGFFEFHSNVYLRLDMVPLLMLTELAEDPEIVAAAGMALDLCLLDLAAHTHKGTFNAARGRTYKNNKTSGRADSTFTLSKFVFDDTDEPYDTGANGTTVNFCAATAYRPPQALVGVALDDGEVEVRERHGIFVDGTAPIVDDPEAPFGYDFDDPDNLTFWWSQGAVGLWQLAEVNLAETEEFRLLEQDALADIALLVALNQNDPELLAEYTQANHAILNFGHLREANTYHWRNEEVALASVLDYRFGEMRDQLQAWVATVDHDAIVTTTHPRSEPEQTTDWSSDGKPGYWTGTASIPRSAQHRRTAIHIYQPAWDETTDPLLWGVFAYLDFTHAYFPQDHFDEVVSEGNWTFGRKGDGYVALWSWRTPTWREHDPAVVATNGMEAPFDLVAEGGPDNVWIAEVGDAGQDDFDSWVAERADSVVTVERDDEGFVVDWTSPATGALTFGSTAAFTVDGEEVPQSDFPRHDSPWGTVDRLEKRYDLAADGSTVTLDFDAMTRDHA